MAEPNMWIVVPNWDKFQHYKDRQPRWIKLYIELLDKPEWRSLSMADRGLLVTIWMAYARSKGQPLQWTHARTYGDTHGNTYGRQHRSLERLNHAGFIQLCASKPLAQIREEKKEQQPTHQPPLDQPPDWLLAELDIRNTLKPMPQ